MPTRFRLADDIAIRETLARHRPVSEKRDDVAGESTILCSCGETFGPLPKSESVVDLFAEHFCEKVKGGAS